MIVWFAGGGTGGHLYPALAIARALVAAEPRVEPFFLGARRGIEREVLPTSGFRHELLDLHPLYRTEPWHNGRTVLGAARAWRRAGRIARSSAPAALVATGGYAAGVALGYAAAHRIPIVIQDQNAVPGLTVRWFAPRARQIHLGFPEAATRLRPGARAEVFASGNPVEPPPEPRPDPAAARARWGLHPAIPMLLVFGGSQGAAAVNDVVAGWVREDGPAAAGVQVLWATGRGTYDRHAVHQGPGVAVVPYIAPMADAYAGATLALSRAGAMSTAELAAWGIPALMVPLPSAAGDHQTANARAIAADGAGVMLPQDRLTPEVLGERVRALLDTPGALARMRERTLRRARPEAAKVIARHILAMLDLT